MRKPESFRGPGKVPGRVLRKPEGRKSSELVKIYLIFIYYVFRKGFGINLMNIISMGSLSLGRPKWGGSTWAKGPQEGGRLGELPGSFPLPLGAALGRR